MAHQGDVIENPVSGDRIVFRKRARDTNGELLQFDVFLKPHGFGPAEHIHSRQEERFQVISGTVCFRVREHEQSASTGQVLVVPPGTPHTLWNDSDDEGHLIVELRPALKTEAFFETIFGLARDGKTNERGIPNLLQGALLAREYEAYLSGPPLPVQKAFVAMVAPIGRLLGYRAWYPRYSRSE